MWPETPKLMLPKFCRCLGLDLLHWVPDLSFSPPHSAAKEKRYPADFYGPTVNKLQHLAK